MARTITKFLDFGRLSTVNGGAAIVALAMVYNDLLTINWALGRFNDAKSSLPNHMHKGMRIYFSRIHNGHLAKGLNAVRKIRDNKTLQRIVGECSPDAQNAFSALCRCLRGGADASVFDRYVGQIRHRIAFHCDVSYLRWGIKNRAARRNASTSTLTAGGTVQSNRFEFVDDLLDTVVCRKVWKIKEELDRRTEADRIGTWCDEKAREYLRFAGEFVELALSRLGSLRQPKTHSLAGAPKRFCR
jgi:hypothetical protein